MSKYTNYEKVAKSYDSVRYASGVETMTGIVSGILRKNTEDIAMLEAGCGTGNYSLGFLKNGIGNLTMIDASNGMLSRAREKVKSYGNCVNEIKQHVLPTIPYPDESFDVVTLIQVMHHLDVHHLNVGTPYENAAEIKNGISYTSNGDGAELNGNNAEMEVPEDTYKDKYPNLVTVIKEAFRVLKPQGVLLIDHSFHPNIDSSWLSLAPKALALWKEAFIAGSDLIDLLKAVNFKNIFYVARPGEALSTIGMFENPELILDEKWRNCCSEWSFIHRTGELPAVMELVKQKKAEGTLNKFAYEQNKLFRLVGESTTVFARKV